MAEEVREVRAPVWEAEVPWVVSYLREDIQDLKGDIREVRQSIERLDAKFDAKFEELRREMDAKIKGWRREMNVQFRWIIGIVIGVMLTMTGVFAWIVDRMLTP